jgi:FixJ family two-component response regulator
VTNNCLIAIIDDDEGMRLSLDGLVRSMGHRTALFANAESFLESAAFANSDCVVSDIHMPGGMSGVELAQTLASSNSPTPIILMTGFTGTEHRRQATDQRVQCLLDKPFNDDTLIHCLEAALRS